jgi:hypothetical protein
MKHGQRFESSPCHVNGNVLLAHPMIPFRNKLTIYQHLLICLAVEPPVHLFICTTVLTTSVREKQKTKARLRIAKSRQPSLKTKHGAGQVLCMTAEHITRNTQYLIFRLAPLHSKYRTEKRSIVSTEIKYAERIFNKTCTPQYIRAG